MEWQQEIIFRDTRYRVTDMKSTSHSSGRLPAAAIAAFPPLFLFVSEVLRAHDARLYIRLFTEDGPFEYAQALMFLGAGFLSLMMARRFRKQGRGIFRVLYQALGVGALFAALEEVSWGQRILSLRTPDLLQEYNHQNEINLHNTVWLQNSDYSISWFYGFLLGLAVYASVAWAAIPHSVSARLGRYAGFLIPGWYLAPYFSVPILCNTVAPCFAVTTPVSWHTQEALEFLAAAGFFAFFLIGMRRLQLMRR